MNRVVVKITFLVLILGQFFLHHSLVSASEAPSGFDYDEYVRAFNTGNDEGLVERFFAEDCVMYSSSSVYRGHKELKEFLAWAHDGVREIIRPQVVLQDDNHLLAEIDMDFVASKVRDDFPFAKLRPGDVITVKFLVAYTLRDGLITELKSMTWPTDRLVTKEPLLGTSPSQRAAFLAYTTAFSQAEYESFAKFYTDDVVLELPSMPAIHGRQGIVDFYSKMFPSVRETLEINQLVIDGGGIAGDFTSIFTAVKDAPDFVVAPLMQGESMRVRVFVYYTLRDGLISHIKVLRAAEPVRGDE